MRSLRAPHRAVWCLFCMRWRTTVTCPARHGPGTGGCRGGYGHGIAHVRLTRRSAGPRRPTSPRSWRRASSARDRLIVLLLARAGLRRGEAAGLRRSDVHLLADSRALGCAVDRAHLHVVRREDNPNGAWAKSRRQRVVPLDFLTVLAFDTYQLERSAVAAAADSDFVLVNLFRPPVGAPMRLDAINELTGAASRRAGIDPPVRPHQLRHAFGSNVADAGNGIDVVADLLGHRWVSSSQVYVHPDPARLRAAVDRVPSPLGGPAVTR